MTDTLKQNIKSLQQVDKLKDEFIIIASHNLRTPLTVIKNYIPFLKRNKVDQRTQGAIAGIEGATERLEAIMESLLNLVSLEKNKDPLKKAPEDLIAIIKDVVDGVRKQYSQSKVTILFDEKQPQLVLDLDKVRIKQALAGVIDNAVKFNRDGGKVAIKLEKKGEEIEILVADTGVGISREELEEIFQKFHRGTDILTYNYEGVGLGLYITKLIVESHQGKIRLDSVLGEGTKVYITLPIHESTDLVDTKPGA
jgi:signal transduction histidine kinase